MLTKNDLKKTKRLTRRAIYDKIISVKLSTDMKKYITKCSERYGYRFLSVFARDILLLAVDCVVRPKKNIKFPEEGLLDYELRIRVNEDMEEQMEKICKQHGYKKISTWGRDVILTALDD